MKNFKFNTRKQNYILVLIANVLNSFVQWLIINFLAKKYGTSEMGAYTFALAWVLPFYSFFQLQLRNILITNKDDVLNKTVFFNIRLISDLLFLLVVNLIGLFLYRDYLMFFLIISGFKFLEMISDLIYGFAQKKENHGYYAKQMILRSILTMSFLIIVFYLDLALLNSLTLIFSSYFLVLIYDLVVSKGININFKIPYRNEKVRSLLKTSLLSGLATFLIYFSSNLPRYFLERYESNFELGIFSGLFYILIVGRILIQALVQISLPSLSKLKGSKNKKLIIRNVRNESIGIFLLGLMQFSIIPFSDEIFSLLYNEDFVNRQELLILILIGGLFLYLSFVYNNLLNAFNYYRWLFPINIVVFLIALLSNFYFVSTYGLLGAGYSFIITAFSQFLILFSISFYILKKWDV